MSTEMADHKFDFDHSGLQEVANAVREDNAAEEANVPQKRKRDASADVRRSTKQRTNTDAESDFLDENHGLPESTNAVDSLQEYANLPDSSNGDDHANASSTAAAALGIFPTMTVPQPTDMQFQAGERNEESFMDDSQAGDQSFNMDEAAASGKGGKPGVGTAEWHIIRKNNHKEVERRRRETINEGINELSKIVPGCEKNKGSILQRAVSFITQLKENEAQNIEKWTLEKLLTEQAIAELSASNDKLKVECERAWREVETWKKTCQSAGLAPKKDDGVASASADS